MSEKPIITFADGTKIIVDSVKITLPKAASFPRTSFARIFPETNTPHRFETGHEWNGLSVCARCGCMEGALLSTCPVQRLTMAETEIAYAAFCAVSEEGREILEAGGEWARTWAAHVSEYNERARRYNDNLLDLAAKESEHRVFHL